jgi:alkylhydroperoxidase/carboxymuconolactone decarboxylase family protein YurZ
MKQESSKSRMSESKSQSVGGHVRSAQEEKARLPPPAYFSAKGMLRDQEWIESYFSTVLQWPKTCTLSLQDRSLLGLAKAVAFNWEPGILNHTDLALRTCSTPDQITEVIKASAATIGLARLEMSAKAVEKTKHSRRAQFNPRLERALKAVRAYYLTVPSCFEHEIVNEDPDWFAELLTVARPAFESSPDVLAPKLRSLVCLAAAVAVGWNEGAKLYSAASRRFGATETQVSDVIRSIFKTSVSNAMAAGFRTPCHIPDLRGYQTMLRAYVEKGGLKKKRKDPLANSRSGSRCTSADPLS